MPGKANHDLHGNAPDKSSVALLVIDMINALDFPKGKQFSSKHCPQADV
jgi:hypothetical protein